MGYKVFDSISLLFILQYFFRRRELAKYCMHQPIYMDAQHYVCSNRENHDVADDACTARNLL